MTHAGQSQPDEQKQRECAGSAGIKTLLITALRGLATVQTAMSMRAPSANKTDDRDFSFMPQHEHARQNHRRSTREMHTLLGPAREAQTLQIAFGQNANFKHLESTAFEAELGIAEDEATVIRSPARPFVTAVALSEPGRQL
jgi:hypothetical protein